MIDPVAYLSDEAQTWGPSPLTALMSKYNASTVPGLIALSGGFPHADFFPITNLSFAALHSTFSVDKYGCKADSQALLDIMKYSDTTLSENELHTFLQYLPSKGHPKFLEHVKSLVVYLHNPGYASWDLLVNCGAGDAISKICAMLLNPGDCILTEDFTYPSTLKFFVSRFIQAVGIDSDETGLSAVALKKKLASWPVDKPRPKALYTIPSGQNPLGTTQTATRRRDIYEICLQENILIIEDDPYAMLTMPEYVSGMSQEERTPRTFEQYKASIETSYLSMDRDGIVIHIASFSKMLAPGLRCGYTVAHESFVERLVANTMITTRSSSGASQVILLEMLSSWGAEGWVRWCHEVAEKYVVRRNLMLDKLQPFVKQGWISLTPPSCGMFLVVNIEFEVSLDALFHECLKQKVLVVPGDYFTAPGIEQKVNWFRLTYASPIHPQIVEGIGRFGQALAQMIKGKE